MVRGHGRTQPDKKENEGGLKYPLHPLRDEGFYGDGESCRTDHQKAHWEFSLTTLIFSLIPPCLSACVRSPCLSAALCASTKALCCTISGTFNQLSSVPAALCAPTRLCAVRTHPSPSLSAVFPIPGYVYKSRPPPSLSAPRGVYTSACFVLYKIWARFRAHASWRTGQLGAQMPPPYQHHISPFCSLSPSKCLPVCLLIVSLCICCAPP